LIRAIVMGDRPSAVITGLTPDARVMPYWAAMAATCWTPTPSC
jgi:hypothetical protein